MTLAELTEKVRNAVGADSGLGKSLKFNLKDAGVVRIEGGTVSNEDLPADLTLTLSMDDLQRLYKGESNAMALFSSGALQVSDPMAAMSLQPKMQALFSKL
jgi:putative sterol carrier protein